MYFIEFFSVHDIDIYPFLQNFIINLVAGCEFHICTMDLAPKSRKL